MSPTAPSPAEPINALADWLADEARVLKRLRAGPGPGVARPNQVAGKTGLQMMQAMLDGEIPHAEIAETLDFLVVEVALGRAVFQGTPGKKHLNPLGSVHGGWFATLLDSALGCAVHTMVPAGRDRWGQTAPWTATPGPWRLRARKGTIAASTPH